MTPQIYTIGYAGWAPGKAESKKLKAEMLAVISAVSDLQLSAFRFQLSQALGNRNAFTGGPVALNDPQRALQPIAALLGRGPVALLCGCANPQRCHRSVAGAFLAERLGAEVEHILAPERSARPGDQLRLPGWE